MIGWGAALCLLLSAVLVLVGTAFAERQPTNARPSTWAVSLLVLARFVVPLSTAVLAFELLFTPLADWLRLIDRAVALLAMAVILIIPIWAGAVLFQVLQNGARWYIGAPRRSIAWWRGQRTKVIRSKPRSRRSQATPAAE